MAKFQFLGGGGGVVWSQNWKYSKCQEMAKFQFSGVGGGTLESKLKILKNFNFGGGEVGGYFGVKTENTQSAKKWLNFHLGGGGFLVWNSRKPLSGEFGQKFTVWGQLYTNLLVHHR